MISPYQRDVAAARITQIDARYYNLIIELNAVVARLSQVPPPGYNQHGNPIPFTLASRQSALEGLMRLTAAGKIAKAVLNDVYNLPGDNL